MGTTIEWPTIREFTIELGKSKIKEYLDFTADVTDNWYYGLYLVDQIKGYLSDYYVYEAKFSMPTRLYPVAQVTVSMFFGFEISKVIPPNCPVKVTYTLEGSNCVYVPGKTLITEEMLTRVAESKMTLYKRVKF